MTVNGGSSFVGWFSMLVGALGPFSWKWWTCDRFTEVCKLGLSTGQA